MVDTGKLVALPTIAVGGVHVVNGLNIMDHIEINMRALAAATNPPLFDFKKHSRAG